MVLAINLMLLKEPVALHTSKPPVYESVCLSQLLVFHQESLFPLQQTYYMDDGHTNKSNTWMCKCACSEDAAAEVQHWNITKVQRLL